MNKAKEMFGKLGYELISYGDEELVNYRKYQQKNIFEQVVFNNKNKNFWCGVTIVKDFDTLIEKHTNPITINVSLFQAINKQIEELGWNNE